MTRALLCSLLLLLAATAVTAASPTEARALLRAGQPATALTMLQQLPEEDETFFLRGVAFDRLGRTAEALAAWRQVTGEPRLADAAYFLAARGGTTPAVLTSTQPDVRPAPPAAATAPVPVRALVASGAELSVSGDGLQVTDAATGDLLLPAVRGTLRLAAGSGGIRLGGTATRSRRVHLSASGPVTIGRGTYRSTVVITQAGGTLQAVNHLDLEEFLYGVIGREMSPRWPAAALQAQAVAARSYALSRVSGRRGETYDFDAAAMIFGGFGAESESTRAAVDATRGLVLQQGGSVVPAYFSADSGGRLATAGEAWGRDLPYFTVRDDPFSAASPYHRWELVLTGWQLGSKLAAWNVGQVQGLEIAAAGPSGRATKIRVRGSRRTVEISGSQFRSALGPDACKSTLFTELSGDSTRFVLRGLGWGHGVGLAQYSAKGMAEAGWSAAQIVAFFFPGATLAPLVP